MKTIIEYLSTHFDLNQSSFRKITCEPRMSVEELPFRRCISYKIVSFKQ